MGDIIRVIMLKTGDAGAEASAFSTADGRAMGRRPGRWRPRKVPSTARRHEFLWLYQYAPASAGSQVSRQRSHGGSGGQVAFIISRLAAASAADHKRSREHEFRSYFAARLHVAPAGASRICWHLLIVADDFARSHTKFKTGDASLFLPPHYRFTTIFQRDGRD